MMYCHNCGAHTSLEQNYCRTCGINLRAPAETTSAIPSTWSSPRYRWQILVEVVTDALRSGIQYISRQPTNRPGIANRASRWRHWGMIAFWAGLAALMGEVMGVILVLTGIGLMAYARGFFGSAKEAPPVHTPEFQAPRQREAKYSRDPHRPPVVTASRADTVPPNAEVSVESPKVRD